MTARRATSQLLSARSVHLRIVPRPANLSESREIFRVLQRFGEMSTFKYLRYEYHNPADNIALAIYRDSAAAQKALDASPIRFALERAATHEDGDREAQNTFDETEDEDVPKPTEPTNETSNPTKDDLEDILSPPRLATRPSPTTPPSQIPKPTLPTPAQTTPATKHFQITLDRARTVHQDYIERQPFWKHFNPMKSMAQEDLAKKVPYPGLSDVSKRPANAHRTPNKVLKQMSEYLERGMPSLRGMAGDSEMERGFRERKGGGGV